MSRLFQVGFWLVLCCLGASGCVMWFNLCRPPFVEVSFKLCGSFFALVVLVCLKLFLDVFMLFLSPLVVPRLRSV